MRDRAQLDLDLRVTRLHDVAKLLPALTARNALEERERCVAALRRGDVPVPRYDVEARRVPPEVWASVDAARALAGRVAAEALYLARIDELELDLHMLEALGDARRIRPLARRRFGTGADIVRTTDGEVRLGDVARSELDQVADTREEASLPATGLPGEPSLAELVRRLAIWAGLEVEVKVEPRLVAAAATGDRIVFVADRLFGAREALRLAVHEVLGHLVAAANGRAQPIRLTERGTAGSFADQEGVALLLEEQAGLMDGRRRRTLAARVVVTDKLHEGAAFGEVARHLVRDLGFGEEQAVGLCERAFRGGGVARDAGYLRGLLRVRDAVRGGVATLDELRSGRVSLDALPTLRALAPIGLYRPAVLRPSLAYSLSATASGTSSLTSPPSVAASFTMFEET